MSRIRETCRSCRSWEEEQTGSQHGGLLGVGCRCCAPFIWKQLCEDFMLWASTSVFWPWREGQGNYRQWLWLTLCLAYPLPWWQQWLIHRPIIPEKKNSSWVKHSRSWSLLLGTQRTALTATALKAEGANVKLQLFPIKEQGTTVHAHFKGIRSKHYLKEK